jgi:lipopolysaccharide kinase (Kdo/WaaP) family protein
LSPFEIVLITNSWIFAAMLEDAIWGEIPQGFTKVRAGRGRWLVVRDDKLDSISASVCRAGSRQEVSRFEGREPLRSLGLANGDTALIRPYRHGGVLRACTGSVFWSWPPRPFRELSITEEIRRRGIPTVETYGAYVEQLCGPFYRGWLVTRELTGAQDLWQAFNSGFVQEFGIDRILRAVADSLRTLHREGVYHTDLNLKNILVCKEPGGVKGYIIDFDKAKLVLGNLPPQLVRRNLSRLLRSVNKLDPTRTYFLTSYWDDFVNFYYDVEAHAV